VKTPNYTYRELVHHLDLHTTDPLVRRLIDYIVEGEDSVMSGLIEAGMDPMSYEFSDSYEYYTPGDYIEHLRKNCQSVEDDLWVAQRELEDVVEERDRLKTRSVADLMASMEEQVKRAQAETVNAQRIARKVEQENDELKEKINVWTILEK
jgi:hypothetical protein